MSSSTLGTDINLTAVRLEALTHDSLPNHGPGRHPTGTFAQISWNVTATSPAGKDPITLEFDNAWADHQFAGYPIDKNGHWNIYGGHGGNCTAIWSMSKPVSLPAGTTLTFEMQCQTGNDRPKTSATSACRCRSDPAAIGRSRISWRRRSSPIPGKNWPRPINSKATGRRLTDWSSDVRSWPLRSAIYSPRSRTRTGNAPSKSTTRPSRPQTSDADLLSRRARALRGAQQVGRRRGRLVAGGEWKPGRGQVARRVRPTTCRRRPASAGKGSVRSVRSTLRPIAAGGP